MVTKNCRAARGTAIESANVREKIRCLSDDSIALGARPCRAKKAMLHRAWQAGRRPQRKLFPATCWIASLTSVARMKGFFYGSSTQNAFIRIVRGALVAAGPPILFAMPAGACTLEANRVVFAHSLALSHVPAWRGEIPITRRHRRVAFSLLPLLSCVRQEWSGSRIRLHLARLLRLAYEQTRTHRNDH
jgi:hypothetical protein